MALAQRAQAVPLADAGRIALARAQEPEDASLGLRRLVAAQTDSEAFRAWFRDSKVVNPDGTPKVVYHGTRAHGGFQAFEGLTYFTENPVEANSYALLGASLPFASHRNAKYRFVEAAGLEIPEAFPVAEVWPTLGDYDGPDDVVFAVEDGLAYRQGWRYYIIQDRKLDSTGITWNHEWNFASGECRVVEGTSDMETAYRDDQAEIDGEAAKESPAVVPVYLSLQNPYVTDDAIWGNRFARRWERDAVEHGHNLDRWLEHARRDLADLIAKGHDGMILPSDGARMANAFGEGPGHDVMNYVVFDPRQIKSAIGNSGAFDPGNPDIRG